MKNKNIIRYGSIAGLVLILLYAFTFFSNDVRSFKQVDTSVAMQQLADKNVEEARRSMTASNSCASSSRSR